MAQERAKNLITISFLDSIASDRRLVAYWRNEKAQTGVEIKAQVSRAVQGYFDVYAVGEDPTSSQAEFERALLDCEIDLTSQLSRIRQYGKTHRHRTGIAYEIPHEIHPDVIDDDDDDDEYEEETREARLARIGGSFNTLTIKD